MIIIHILLPIFIYLPNLHKYSSCYLFYYVSMSIYTDLHYIKGF